SPVLGTPVARFGSSLSGPVSLSSCLALRRPFSGTSRLAPVNPNSGPAPESHRIALDCRVDRLPRHPECAFHSISSACPTSSDNRPTRRILGMDLLQCQAEAARTLLYQPIGRRRLFEPARRARYLSPNQRLARGLI